MVELKKINDFEWEISAQDGMNVPGRIFASEKLIENIKDDKSLEQVRNVARLPGILGGSYAMPDMHQGYGFPIGGVAAFDIEKGVISPGGVGYDINCSVRLLRTNLVEGDLKGREKELVHSLSRCVPSGVGVRGSLKLDNKKLDEVLKGGAQWAVENSYGFEDDWKHIEDEGKLDLAEPKFVSAKARGRGMNQLGTLGAGNHFLDVLIVDEIFDEKVAKVFGLEKGQVVILIHCGSRGLGHQVASDYIQLMSNVEGLNSANLGGSQSEIVDGSKTESSGGSSLCDGGLAKGDFSGSDFLDFVGMGLACAPIKSELGKKYFGAMCAAANFAFANKQIITHFVRENLKRYFSDFEANVVYDICHNIAKFEKHVIREEMVNGKWEMNEREVLVMRKGATRAFGQGRKEIPIDYRDYGQPVLLPGSMGTPSYVLVGTEEAMKKSFGSCAHGAGRVRSRSEAHKKMTFNEAVKDMESRGVFVEAGGIAAYGIPSKEGTSKKVPFSSGKGMIEEAPGSYKDVKEVVRVCDSVGLGRKVAKLIPKLVVIG
jgi:tRNA-splicing ligase RtcB